MSLASFCMALGSRHEDTETIGELSHTLVWGCLEGTGDSESCISLASWVLERDQMGILIMVGDMHSVPQERTGYQDSVQVLSLGRKTPENSRRRQGNELEKIRQLIKMLSNKVLGWHLQLTLLTQLWEIGWNTCFI